MRISDQSVGMSAFRTALAARLDVSASSDQFSGVALVTAPEGRVIEARGLANAATGELNTTATRFNTASLTKLFTAIAVCRVLESDPSAFDRPIRSWLGDTVSSELAQITVHQALVHVSGLPEQVPDEPGGVIGEDWLAPLVDVHLDFAPGTRWQYSNAGYSLLGAVIERVTASSYFEAMRTLVFDPVGMTATGFEDTAESPQGRALGYAADPLGGLTDTRDAGLGRGAPYGYAFSSVADIERLLRAVADHRVVTPESASRILCGTTPTGEPGRYAGFGMFLEQQGAVRFSTSAGAGPGLSAWLDFLPDAGIISVALANRARPAAHGLGQWIRDNGLIADVTPRPVS